LVGVDNVREVDRRDIIKRVGNGLWKGPFSKLWLFNLTDFDKIIVLDGDVLIRTNIAHWFDYDTPSASQQGDNIEWNSGAMVIEPNADVFHWMVDRLSRVRRYEPNKTDASKGETWNSGHGHQGFLSSIFTAPDTPPFLRMKTMPTESSLLTSRLKFEQFEYWNKFRRHIYETIHFTVHKPWKTRTDHPVVCDFLREWNDSMEGIERFNISLYKENLGNCPPRSTLPKPENFWKGFHLGWMARKAQLFDLLKHHKSTRPLIKQAVS
jgi:hypothetical protein